VGQNPSTVLQIAHLACSGATTSTLVSTQVPAAAAAFPPGEVDAIVMTIGANDTVSGKGDFGSVVESCLKDDNCHTSTSLKTEISNKLDALPGSYATVDVTVRSQFPRAQVYLAEYYDATHHADGSFGNFATNFGCTFDLITADEWKFIHDSFLVPLNAAGATAASLHQWHYIGGIADAFKKHGMCAGDERWVLTAEDSIDQMGGVKPTLDISFYKFHFSYNERALKGTAHPNHEGHLQYGLAIAHALNAGTPPQTRATATGVDGPYPFGTWTRGPVVITFELRNLLGAGDLGTRWRFAGGTPATPPGDLVERYFGPFEWDRPGHWTFFYGSTSGFGAVEAVQRVTVMIDPIPPFTKPTATASGKPYTFGSKIGGTVNVSLGAVELGGDQSGVRDLTYSAIGAQPVPATTVLGDSASLVITKPGVTAITLKARDVAGNVSDSQTVTVDICGADASSRVAVIRGGFRKNFNTGRMVQTVTLTNRGSTSLVGPFSLVVRDLPAGVTLANATPGTCTSGGPAIQVPATLAPSQSTVIVLEFTTSSSAGITYTTQVLTGPAG
jgi:hypothetical protein